VSTAIHAEWTKLRTVAAPGWLLLAGAVLTVALGVLASAAASCSSAGCGLDPTKGLDPIKLSLTGVQLGQAVIAVLAVLVVGNEYHTGMIRTTLAAVPRRPVALAAKALVVVGPVLLVGSVAIVGSLLTGRIIMSDHGILAMPLTSASVLRTAVGSVLYLALIGLLALGIASAVRDSATAIGVVLGLLYLFPILASVVGDPHWQRHIQQIGPSSAGLAVQATVGVDSLPIGPWAGLGVLALWAGGALLIGGLLLHFRDA
jgi:ABC-2 type transport system permease protein